MLLDLFPEWNPFFESVFAYFVLTFVTKFMNFSLLRVTFQAEVFEEYVDNEVIRDYRAPTEALRTQFLLSGFDVISSLDEWRIEGESEQGGVVEAEIGKLEDHLNVAIHQKVLLLVICKFENDTTLLAYCLSMWIGELLRELISLIDQAFISIDLVYFEERSTCYSDFARHFDKLNSFKSFEARWLDFLMIQRFKVVEISELTWLSDSFTAWETLMAKKSQAVIDVVKVPHIQQNSTNCWPSTAFPCIAMDNQNIVSVRYVYVWKLPLDDWATYF